MTGPSDPWEPDWASGRHDPGAPSDPTEPASSRDDAPGTPGGRHDPGAPNDSSAAEVPQDGGAPADTRPDDAVPYDGTGRPDAGAPPRTVDPRRKAARHGRTRHPWRLAALVVIVVGALVLVGGYLWVRSEADPSGPQGNQVIVTVPQGSGESATGTLLADKGVIGSPLAFRLWSQFNSLPGIEAGTYAFRTNSSFGEVQAVLASGPNVFPLVVPPGFTVSELADRVGQLPGHDADSFDKVATDGSVRSPWQPAGVTSLEGLLAPGTYTVTPGETDQILLQKMVDRFDAQAAQLDLTTGAAALGYTPYQVVIVASIVEKEGVLTKNMGPVARVIYNRLAKDMPLQMDSTVLYALGRDGGPVTSADLKTVSPYNTYLNKGLPPTPTCFPSNAALAAALHPTSGSWLYFVVVEQDGTEAFSDTFAGQQANEALATQRGLG